MNLLLAVIIAKLVNTLKTETKDKEMQSNLRYLLVPILTVESDAVTCAGVLCGKKYAYG